MSFETMVASKYLLKRRRTTVASIGGICTGVAALIVVLAVFTGFQSQLKATMVSVHPHIRIEKWGGMNQAAEIIRGVEKLQIPGMTSLSPFVTAEAVIQAETGAAGIVVKGVDPTREDLSIFNAHLAKGYIDLEDEVLLKEKRRLLFFKRTVRENVGKILIGESLARTLRLSVGDSITLIAPTFAENTKAFSLRQAEARRFIVSGIFRLGMSDFDASYVLISIPQAQALYHLGDRVNGVGVRFHDVDEALRWSALIRSNLTADYWVSTWHDVNPNFFRALKVEKGVQTIFLGLILLVASFNIFSTLIMMVMEKTKDIGILRALGARKGSIRKIFLIQGVTVGMLGVTVGVAAGLLILQYRNDILAFIKRTTGYELFPSDIYLFDGLPAQIEVQDVLSIVAFALVASILASIYPAHRAAKLNPVEALRYE